MTLPLSEIVLEHCHVTGELPVAIKGSENGRLVRQFSALDLHSDLEDSQLGTEQQFLPFLRLPIEIRLQIWEIASLEPQIIDIRFIPIQFIRGRTIPGSFSGLHPSCPIRNTCNEAREVCDSIRPAISHPEHKSKNIPPLRALRQDTLWVRNPTAENAYEKLLLMITTLHNLGDFKNQPPSLAIGFEAWHMINIDIAEVVVAHMRLDELILIDQVEEIGRGGFICLVPTKREHYEIPGHDSDAVVSRRRVWAPGENWEEVVGRVKAELLEINLELRSAWLVGNGHYAPWTSRVEKDPAGWIMPKVKVMDIVKG